MPGFVNTPIPGVAYDGPDVNITPVGVPLVTVLQGETTTTIASQMRVLVMGGPVQAAPEAPLLVVDPAEPASMGPPNAFGMTVTFSFVVLIEGVPQHMTFSTVLPNAPLPNGVGFYIAPGQVLYFDMTGG